MKTLLVTLTLLTSTLVFGDRLRSPQDHKPAPAAAAQDPLKPGPQHAMLQKLAGTWDAVLSARDQTGAEQKTKGTMTTRKHTDFHTVDDFQGEFMGMKFVGHGVNGYCNVKQQFFMFWTDSMTPSPMALVGSYDAKQKALVMTGECFGASGKLEPCRTVTRYQDDDHYSWAFFGTGPDGKEMQYIAIEYTRKK